MAKSRKYRCPEQQCRAVFNYLHHPNEAEDPVRFCPKCGFDCQADEDNPPTVEVAAPHVQNYAVVKGADYTYRAMEESSAHHALMAAEMAGCDASEMASLKITDTKDNLQYGEIGVMPVQNSVTQAMQQSPGAGHGGGVVQIGGVNHTPVSLAAAAHTGDDKFAGLRAMSSIIRPAHAKVGGGALSSEIVPLEIANRTIAPHLTNAPGRGGRQARGRR